MKKLCRTLCLALCLAVLVILTLSSCGLDVSVNLDASLRQRLSGTVTDLFTEETSEGTFEVMELDVPGLGKRYFTLTEDTRFYQYDPATNEVQETPDRALLQIGARVEIESERTRDSDRHLLLSVTLFSQPTIQGSAL